MRARFTTIEFPVFFNYIVHVEVTSDLKKSMLKYPPTKDILMEDDCKDAITVHVCDASFSFIFLHYTASVGTIAHESWHAVKHMLEYMGVELDSETVAYHLGYMVDKIFKFVRGRK